MTIAEVGEKCKSLLAQLRGRVRALPRDILIVSIILLASLFSFGLGYLAGVDSYPESPLSIEAQ